VAMLGIFIHFSHGYAYGGESWSTIVIFMPRILVHLSHDCAKITPQLSWFFVESLI
jgi:hypothetical protein